MQDFGDKVAVITGAAGGIGAALAAGFSSEGAKVVVADIDIEGATATAGAIGGSAVAVGVDVADRDSVEALADAAWDAFGQVDLLFNNAGVFQAGLMWERTQADWDWVLGVNVYGIINGVAAFVPRMIAQDTEGRVVNTASVAAFVAGGFTSPYVVSKCAAFSLTECLALDLAAVGAKIGASVLTPSAIDTAIAHTARVRDNRYGTDESEDNAFVVESLSNMTADGISPTEVVSPVMAGIRAGDFLIPTKPSYANQIQVRYDALLERRIPPTAVVD
ncbi:SDR family NAD(P)-dependent oxidoreductase [Candidatus Poriferisocius sp.]|uniref:SDR family NAD(P)-dependent oxidoreductase n=1 Tax=Candidatus Poriferisocius sp. TaxID=3101276 RepID=UPI003B01D5EC